MAQLQVLPTELLDRILIDIASHEDSIPLRPNMQSRDIISLMRVSKLLCRRLEPMLYGNISSTNAAMVWGCRCGSPDAVRIAVRYGQPPSAYFQIEGAWDLSPGGGLSTLLLAAEKGHSATFAALLELGARIDDVSQNRHSLRRQSRRLVRAILSKKQEELLSLFLDGRLDEQAREVGHGHEIAGPLTQSLSMDSLALTARLIERGADPNRRYGVRGNESVTPLSMAIMQGLGPAARELLSRGADIDGKKLLKPTRRGLHLPVFAAAVAMGSKPYGIEMMKICLEAGAKLNCTASILGKRWGKRSKYARCWFRTTPLSVFLDNVVWHNNRAGFGDAAITNLTFLLDNGAWVDVANSSVLYFKYYRRHVPRHISSVERLLERFGLARLRHPTFHALFQLLVQRGAARGAHVDLLRRHIPDEVNSKARAELYHPKPGRLAIARFIEIIVGDIPSADVSTVLAQFIYSLASQKRPLGKPFIDTVDALIDAGGDINIACPARLGPRNSLQGASLRPVLIEILRDFSLWGADAATFRAEDRDAPDQRLWLVRFLLSKGADPNFFSFPDKCTALDFVKEQADKFDGDMKMHMLQTAFILGMADPVSPPRPAKVRRIE